MVEALKKLDRKFLIIVGCLICIPILIIIFLAIVQSCGSKTLSYEKYEDKMISAAEKYFKKKNIIPTEESELVTVSLDDLVSNGYIKSPEKLVKDKSCTGNVSVRRNGSSIEENEGGYLNYTVQLSCDSYSTKTLSSVLKNSLVSEGEGLYQVGDMFIFKGDDPKNVVSISDEIYRILSIDENNILKLLKVEPETINHMWDNKYNTEVNSSVGKNIYEDSVISKRLEAIYNDSKKFKDLKDKIILKDICIEARDINNYDFITSEASCSKILENQPVSLINVSDFANASLDAECLNINSKSCRNYNYLKNYSLSTWTVNAVSNNSYQVYYLENNLVSYMDANNYNEYNIVIYIDGNEREFTGTGKQSDPFIIK